MDKDAAVTQSGSGAVAQDGSVAAGAGGVAVGRDVHGDVTVINVTYQGVQVTIPSPQAVGAYRAALAQELADVHWGMDTYIEEEGALLPLDALPYDPHAGRQRESLLGKLKDSRRLLVLGEPGSGKSVALQRLAWELAQDDAGTVPVLVPLLTYAGSPLLETVRAELQHTGHLRFDDLRAVETFLAQEEIDCHFLFDGLNEVPPSHRDRAVGELSQLLRAQPRHAAALTSRNQDETWRPLRATGVTTDAVVIQPISVGQIQIYLAAHLGEERGRALFGQLDEHLRDLARTPLLLWLIKEAGAAGEELPGNRGELFGRFVDRLLRRAGELGLPRARRDALRPALARLAFELHRRQVLVVSRPEAARLLAGATDDQQPADLVEAAADHGLLTGGDQLRFAPHETTQEYFAAVALRQMAEGEAGPGLPSRLRRWLRARDLRALAGDDWWAEAFVQLAGLVDDPDRLIRTVARANPWLAWWCVTEGRDVSEATRRWVEGRSARLLRSERTADRRRAVQALAGMQSEQARERTIEPLFQAAADRDEEVARLAVGALLGMGEVVRKRALPLAQQPEVPLHRAGLAYLSALLGQLVVYVPPGPFLMGSDRTRDPEAAEEETPQHQLSLPGYWIGCYPVTVARFRAFAAESGHQPADAESLEGQDDHPVVKVTWHEALAYCRWLAAKSGLPVTLPSEAEWEKAARGTDGWIYPWGDEPPDENRYSFGGQVDGTTQVGRYSPQGDSPWGCADMAGNVWEWTRSLWGREWEKPEFGYPYDPGDGRENLQEDDRVPRMVRGGSFRYDRRSVRCAYRFWDYPGYGYGDVGFRVVVAPVPSGL